MKKTFITLLFLTICIYGQTQNGYWVFFTDKNGCDFDPYSYFDSKAIERYNKLGINLLDISNYPVSEDYVGVVAAYADELIGVSRWHNAVGIMAASQGAEAIRQLPFVEEVVEYQGNDNAYCSYDYDNVAAIASGSESAQIQRFGSDEFSSRGIDGSGLRIAVLDGGFPSVDTHPAFEHLREGGKIVATYNFPNDREDVYGWNSHGTMVLSCITGVYDGTKLGLATGSEFLLARTEINSEPFKEEVWWEMGMEWADKNGADIINSSLGYGKQRYYTRDMDGTSYVARAANIAAAKGILVCCSAGNEGTDRRWRTIVTPSDADSVVCVGGIEASNSYRHINFSSYGPTADGRPKPDVVAFGEATVASPSGKLTTAFGTSFSSPLTAGFCACAWQTRRDLNALQLKEEIIKSADLYPYHDYAFGYGVPQASYFTQSEHSTNPSFHLTSHDDTIEIHIVEPLDNESYKHSGNEIFVSIGDENGLLGGFHQLTALDTIVTINVNQLGKGNIVSVSHKGYFSSTKITNDSADTQCFTPSGAKVKLSRNTTFYKPKNENLSSDIFIDIDGFLRNSTWNKSCTHIGIGYRLLYGWKRYHIGGGLSLDFNKHRSDKLAIDKPYPDELAVNKAKSLLKATYLRIAFTQRVMILPDELYVDIEAFGGLALSRKTDLKVSLRSKDTEKDLLNGEYVYSDKEKHSKTINLFQYGVTARLGYSVMSKINIAFSGSYVISDIITRKNDPVLGNINKVPSQCCFGIELGFRL